MTEVVRQKKIVQGFIVGGEKLKGKLQQQINDLGLEGNVKLVGRQASP